MGSTPKVRLLLQNLRLGYHGEGGRAVPAGDEGIARRGGAREAGIITSSRGQDGRLEGDRKLGEGLGLRPRGGNAPDRDQAGGGQRTDEHHTTGAYDSEATTNH